MNRGLDLLSALGLLVATVAVLALFRNQETRRLIQGIDDSFLEWLTQIRSGFLTLIAKVLNVVGGIWVTLPVRVSVAGYLAYRRRWWHFTAFVIAMVLSEVTTTALKILYDRPRPSGALVPTSGAAFPSGHAVATSVTLLAVVIALSPPAGFRRWVWGVLAVVLSFVMALSRAYLGAHWLSDVVAGTLLGASLALVTALIVESVRAGPGRGPHRGDPGEALPVPAPGGGSVRPQRPSGEPGR